MTVEVAAGLLQAVVVAVIQAEAVPGDPRVVVAAAVVLMELPEFKSMAGQLALPEARVFQDIRARA